MDFLFLYLRKDNIWGHSLTILVVHNCETFETLQIFNFKSLAHLHEYFQHENQLRFIFFSMKETSKGWPIFMNISNMRINTDLFSLLFSYSIKEKSKYSVWNQASFHIKLYQGIKFCWEYYVGILDLKLIHFLSFYTKSHLVEVAEISL